MNPNSSSGSLPYMGPEMFTSRPESVKATDIWAFGVTLYELITGELPFFGQGGAMMNYGATVPELDYHDKNIVSIVKACLSKETWSRPTAEDIIHKEQIYDSHPSSETKHESVPDEVITIIKNLEKEGEYKEAYNKCLECIRNNIHKEFAEKEIPQIIPVLKKDARRENGKQTVLLTISAIITIVIAIMIALS